MGQMPSHQSVLPPAQLKFNLHGSEFSRQRRGFWERVGVAALSEMWFRRKELWNEFKGQEICQKPHLKKLVGGSKTLRKMWFTLRNTALYSTHIYSIKGKDAYIIGMGR